MPVSQIAKTIVAAATPRRFFANSVITNQGHPADHLFLLTRGLVRYFFVTEEGNSFSGLEQEIYSVVERSCRQILVISPAPKR